MNPVSTKSREDLARDLPAPAKVVGARAGCRRRWTSQVKLLPTLFLALLAAPVMPQSFERTAGVIGLLPLPEVFGFEPCARFEPQDVTLFRSPTTVERIGRIHVAKPWTFHKEGGCEGLLVKVATTDSVANGDELPTMEFGYEQPGAIVLRQTDSWFEITLRKGTGWVRVKDGGRFLPVEQLLKDNLIHLRQGVPIPLHTSPDNPAPPVASTRTAAEIPIKLLGFKRVAGTRWVQIASLSTDPCTQEKLLVDAFVGWLPFHDAKAQPSVWFRSRGC